MTNTIAVGEMMKKAERRPYRPVRQTGVVLTFVAWFAFIISFFLPTAAQIGSMVGAPLAIQNGWTTFVESLTLSAEAVGNPWQQFHPLAILCYLSPIPNGLMLLAPLVNMKTRHYAAFFGVILFLNATTAIWLCWEVYDGIAIGFYFWITSIFLMALASFLISGSYVMEDNIEHERMLAELKELP